jgi:Spherulation-specific family 4
VIGRRRRRRPRPRDSCLLVVLAGALPLAAVILLAPAATAPTCQRVAVPAYFYPGPSWTQSIASKPVPSVMILDVSGVGAGTAPDRNYQAVVKKAQAAGIKVMGYVSTDYGLRRAALAEADIRNYKSWYKVTDIFLDQAAASTLGLAYYRLLTNFIHQVNPGSAVMLNPGVYPSEQYMALGDIMMVYEGPYASYVNLRVPTWASKYPASRFVHTIYATPASKLASTISLARSRKAGYIYVTGNSGVNPYSSLPSYWVSENSAVAAECPSGTA